MGVKLGVVGSMEELDSFKTLCVIISSLTSDLELSHFAFVMGKFKVNVLEIAFKLV